jgi:hypothetical protein
MSAAISRIPDGLHAVGGAPLEGDSWVRVLYLDESGIGKIEKDPHLVVAGVLVHVDRQYFELKQHISRLLADATPPGATVPSVIHTVDLYHGNGEFPRDVWPKDVRHALMDKVAAIPAQFQLPVVWGLIDRQVIERHRQGDTARQQLIDNYAMATVQCVVQLEWHMRRNLARREVASITLENNSDLQRRIGEVFRLGTSGEMLNLLDDDVREGARDLLPITRVIDEPSYQTKTSASLLQLADFCAFAMKRAAGKLADHERFAAPLAPATLRWGRGREPRIVGPMW